MTERWYGSKYDGNLDTAEIAKRYRADVKAAIAAGELPKGLKLSVRIDRFSGGSSIHATIKAAPGVRVYNPEWLTLEAEGKSDYWVKRLTGSMLDLVNNLERMLKAYNHDGSDSMSDHFDVRFYGGVDLDGDLGSDELEAFKAGNLPPLPAAPDPEPEPAAPPTPCESAPKADPAPDRDPLPTTGIAVRFNWSESEHVDCEKVFRSFAAADAHLKEAEALERVELNAAGGEWRGYRKTDFEISIEGLVYHGRYDIGCDEPTLAEHVVAFADETRNGFLARAEDEEKVYYAKWAALVRATIALEAVPATVLVKSAPMFPGVGVLGGSRIGVG